jgi:pimeloyl-ACP methyl ester carboxylesterase
MSQVKKVDGIDVHIDGEGEDVIVMIHGWPDTYRLWDAQVADFKHRYRCVRFTLPGFDPDTPRRAYSLDATIRSISYVINAISNKKKVILMLHDWGCVFGYEYYMRNKQQVSAIIGVDIGDASSQETRRSRTLSQKLKVSAYQNTLSLAWAIGGPIGNMLTRRMANALNAPSAREYIGAQMNYPYYILSAGEAGSYRNLQAFVPKVPMLYIYGVRKPFMFHSNSWLEKIEARKSNKVIPFNTDHWPMLRQPERFNEAVQSWLGPSSAPSHDAEAASESEVADG